MIKDIHIQIDRMKEREREREKEIGREREKEREGEITKGNRENQIFPTTQQFLPWSSLNNCVFIYKYMLNIKQE